MKIPTIKLELKRTKESENLKLGFEWAYKQIGNRWKIGGEPDWIQSSPKIICNECNQEMTFYAQLDSINDEIMIKDCGLIFVFVCFNCFVVKSFIQSY
jgi:hypothetical protein